MKTKRSVTKRSVNEAVRMHKRIVAAYNMTERPRDQLKKLSECFANFGVNPEENINHLVKVCGELMGADCALYNRLEEDALYSIGVWNVPDGFNPCMKPPEGYICYDLIKKEDVQMFVLRNLLKTKYAKTDPYVKEYGLRTYIGHVVKLGDIRFGALCVVYQKDFVPHNEERQLMGAIASAIATEEQRRKEESYIRRSEEEFRLAFESAKDAIFWADPKTGIIIRCNKAAELLLEKTRDEIIGIHQTDLHPASMKKYHASQFKDHIKMKSAIDAYAEVITKSGKIKPVHITSSTTIVAGRDVIQGIFRDITEIKRNEMTLKRMNRKLLAFNRRLHKLSLKDPHTGLYNHNYFGEIIESEFYRAKRNVQPLSMIMIDIDYFKSLNDAYGHSFGDFILKQFSRKLRKSVRLHDHVIRFGGEEFAIVLPMANRTDALTLAKRIAGFMKGHSFGNKKNSIKLKLSLGVCSYPDDNSIFKSSDFIEVAERILSKAKELGGDRICDVKDIKDNGYFPNKVPEGLGVSFMKRKLSDITMQVNQSLTESIFAFAKTIKCKDRYAGQHVEKTVFYATEIAKKLALPEEDIRIIEQAAILHDLGKIGISEKILLKKKNLTTKEFRKIKDHPKIAIDIIRPIKSLHGLIPLILYHHERWDGNGYPSGLKGREIPVGARIIAIADVYQALTSDRPYRKAFSEKKALSIIRDNSGTQFDPEIAYEFLNILGEKE